MACTAIKTLEYPNVSIGDHFIDVKFKKDGSGSNGNDSLQIKLLIRKLGDIIYEGFISMDNPYTLGTLTELEQTVPTVTPKFVSNI